MRIEVTARAAFGVTRFYPANKAAELLAEIAGTATLTRRTLVLAGMMGAEVVLDGNRTLQDLIGAA